MDSMTPGYVLGIILAGSFAGIAIVSLFVLPDCRNRKNKEW